MEAFFEHLIKSSFILLLFLVTYHVFLKRETFFTSNRLYLIGGLLTSFILPFVTITKTVFVTPTSITSAVPLNSEVLIASNQYPTVFDWNNLYLSIYLLGVCYFTIRLLLQLRAVQTIKRNSTIIAQDNLYHVHTKNQISPFSFFRHIFYHPKQFSPNELKTIITHEKVHAIGLHSLDILLTEIIFVLLWFNPAVWNYKTIVKQNLEFLADAETCATSEDKRHYQYLMLKQATNNHKITIVNPFFNSIIKKRIVMLNQTQSKRINLIKILIVLPFLGIFLVAFNTKEVVKFADQPKEDSAGINETPIFVSPLNQDDLQKVSARFGPVKNPFSKEVEMHTGIDMVAAAGKRVSASAGGKVVASKEDKRNGNYILLEHKDGFSTKYAHLKDRAVKINDIVKSGDMIGHVGNTGKSTGTHLHFEILKSGKALDPMSFIPIKMAQKPTTSITKIKTNTIAGEQIELVIDKNTSDAELLKIKADLTKENIDFSYKTVRNEMGEIQSLSLQIASAEGSSEKFSTSYESRLDENAIKPTYISINTDNNSISIGSGKTVSHGSKPLTKVWVSDNDDSDSKEIIIKKINGKKIVTINGEEVDEEDLEDVDINIEEDTNIFITDDKEGSKRKK
ncbi:M23/M56 family metallopeptidase [Maribacter aestuarii]|uniref:M23/M56 family metallopeptidase n=1 Tax=Maribacter aestuarii TaxID=1130723 RepID=UPI00248AAB1A|nr:M23/M56 family metallopeptidase [Maribacter aestuarii]